MDPSPSTTTTVSRSSSARGTRATGGDGQPRARSSLHPHRGTRYKEKFQMLRERYDQVNAKHDAHQRDLEVATAMVKKLQAENDLLLDAMHLATVQHPSFFKFDTDHNQPLSPQPHNIQSEALRAHPLEEQYNSQEHLQRSTSSQLLAAPVPYTPPPQLRLYPSPRQTALNGSSTPSHNGHAANGAGTPRWRHTEGRGDDWERSPAPDEDVMNGR